MTYILVAHTVLFVAALLRVITVMQRQHDEAHAAWTKERDVLLTRILHPQVIFPAVQPAAQEVPAEPDDFERVGRISPWTEDVSAGET